MRKLFFIFSAIISHSSLDYWRW